MPGNHRPNTDASKQARQAWTPPPPIPPRRGGSVHPSKIACPDCGAQPGSKCISAAGTPTGHHRSRKRMAVRKERFSD